MIIIILASIIINVLFIILEGGIIIEMFKCDYVKYYLFIEISYYLFIIYVIGLIDNELFIFLFLFALAYIISMILAR